MFAIALAAASHLIAVDVTGMPPQLDRALAVAKTEGWTVACKGSAGEERVIRFAFARDTNEDAVEAALGGRARFVSSTTYYYTDKPMPLRCNHTPVRGYLNRPTQVLALGPDTTLVALMNLAHSCGLKKTIVRDFSKQDLATSTMVVPPGWKTLDAGEDIGARNGPTICFAQLMRSAVAARSAD